MTDIFSVLACPLCSCPMHMELRSFVCSGGHTFDMARSGYVNLLPPGKGRNSRTGDERAMIKSRESFLSLGYYDRISQKAAEIISGRNISRSPVLLDLGCGEGRHTLNVTRELYERGFDVLSLGFDASKYAAECGMKRADTSGAHGRAYFFPANIFSLPVSDSCADICLSMFAPIPWKEIHRALKKDGSSYLLAVSSGKNHLIELRELIYDSVVLSEKKPRCESLFAVCSAEETEYKIHLGSPEEIKSLFTMTPFYHKSTEEGRERLFSRGELNVTVHVNYTLLEPVL